MVLFGLSSDWIFSATAICMLLGLLPIEAACGNEMKRKMKAANPNVLFLSIGGNDISPASDPKEIFKGICELVQDFQNTGVCHVCISEILQRAVF